MICMIYKPEHTRLGKGQYAVQKICALPSQNHNAKGTLCQGEYYTCKYGT